jgi:hypothetical protein
MFEDQSMKSKDGKSFESFERISSSFVQIYGRKNECFVIGELPLAPALLDNI